MSKLVCEKTSPAGGGQRVCAISKIDIAAECECLRTQGSGAPVRCSVSVNSDRIKVIGKKRSEIHIGAHGDTARGLLGHIAELKDILFTLDMKSAWLYAEGHRTWSAIPPASQNELLALVDEHNSLTATLQELRPAFDEAYNAAIPPYVDALALAEAEFEQKRRRCDELTRQIRQFTASAEPSALQKQIETEIEIEMLGKEVDALMTTEEDLGTFLRFKTVMNHWDPEGKHTWVIWAKPEQATREYLQQCSEQNSM